MGSSALGVLGAAAIGVVIATLLAGAVAWIIVLVGLALWLFVRGVKRLSG